MLQSVCGGNAVVSDWLKDALVLDFETLCIRDRPRHPPPPVGVSLQEGINGKVHYYAFGHLDGNEPGAYEKARAIMAKAWERGRPVLTHNGMKFDLEVAEVHMGLPALPWEQV